MTSEARLLARFWRNHWLTVAVAVLAVGCFSAFTWGEYGYFCDQAEDHHTTPCPGFWSSEHLHDWVYNAASNWQSELFFGVLLVVLLHRVRGGDG